MLHGNEQGSHVPIPLVSWSVACAVEALAQGGDSIDMGTGDFILLIRWQGAIGRDWRSGGGLKHLAWVLGRSRLRQGQ